MDPELREDHLKRLAEAGIDGPGDFNRSAGAAALAGPYLRDDHFDQDGMLTFADELLGSGAAAGNPLIRFVSKVEPSLVDKAGEVTWLNTRRASTTRLANTTIR